jgi:hypothetical protein
VSDASSLQVQRSARAASRLCAALTALWFVACGVMGLRHQAEVSHVRDAGSGVLRHAPRIIGTHSGGTDVHGCRDQQDDHGICGLGPLDQPAVSSSVEIEPAHDVWRAAIVASSPESATLAARQVFRLAPKTSPPTV